MSWLKGKRVPLQIKTLVEGDITGGFAGSYISIPMKESFATMDEVVLYSVHRISFRKYS